MIFPFYSSLFHKELGYRREKNPVTYYKSTSQLIEENSDLGYLDLERMGSQPHPLQPWAHLVGKGIYYLVVVLVFLFYFLKGKNKIY